MAESIFMAGRCSLHVLSAARQHGQRRGTALRRARHHSQTAGQPPQGCWSPAKTQVWPQASASCVLCRSVSPQCGRAWLRFLPEGALTCGSCLRSRARALLPGRRGPPERDAHIEQGFQTSPPRSCGLDTESPGHKGVRHHGIGHACLLSNLSYKQDFFMRQYKSSAHSQQFSRQAPFLCPPVSEETKSQSGRSHLRNASKMI